MPGIVAEQNIEKMQQLQQLHMAGYPLDIQACLILNTESRDLLWAREFLGLRCQEGGWETLPSL